MNTFHPTARTFYRLRRSLIEILGVERQAIRPSTRLEELIPADRRRAVWKELRKRELALPALRLPARVSGIAVTSMALCAALFCFGFQTLLAVLAILRLGFTTWLVTRPFAVHIRSGPVTVRDAVLYLTPFKDHRAYPWSREEISTKVRLIVSVDLGVPVADVKMESRFIEDLGG